MSNNKQSSVDKEFVPYEEALALKELGFDEPCFGWYQSSKLKKEYHPLKNSGNQSFMRKEDCNAPTFSQAFRWFREKYNIHSYIDQLKEYNNKLVYDFVLVSEDGEDYEDNRRWKTCEEAELECLRELIEIVQAGNK